MNSTNIPSNPQPLQAYMAEMETELRTILRFWQEKAVDEQQGGFVGQMDHAGRVNAGAPKGGVLNARILWSFSAAYRHTGDPQQLQLATRAYHYLHQHFLDSQWGGIFWSVDAAGQPLNTRKQIYALAFAIYGLSEYYRACGEKGALDTSKALFNWIETHSFDAVHGGYFEAFSREGTLLDDLRLSDKDRNDPKTMNTHLHILEAYANLYRIWPDASLAKQLEGLLRLFQEKIVDGRSGQLTLFFNRAWQPTAHLISYGHDIEASWLLPEAAEVLGNRKLMEGVETLGLRMARATAENLQPDGSLFHELDVESGHRDRHREWWVSAEAMVGFLNAYQLSGEATFLEQSLGAWRFAKKHLLDGQAGEWRWGVYDDYSPMLAEDKIGFWKCPYHNSRACLEVIARCRQLLHHTG